MGSDTNIESTDLSHLVQRVWVGNKYDYPNLRRHLNDLFAQLAQVTRERDIYKAECEAARALTRANTEVSHWRAANALRDARALADTLAPPEKGKENP